MPTKTIMLSAALVGLVVVLVILALGKDPDVQARTGARWKRRLLTAGLALLAMFGYQPTVQAGKAPRHHRTVRRALTANQEWQRLIVIYHHAELYSEQPPRAAPFYQRGKDKLLKDLAEAEKLVHALARKHRLFWTEARLLAMELRDMTAAIRALHVRPPEPKVHHRGPPGRMPPDHPLPSSYPRYRPYVQRIKKRIPFLRKLARRGRMHLEVLNLLKNRIERDMDVAKYAQPGQTGHRPNEAARAKRLSRSCRRLWQRLVKKVRRANPPPFRHRRTCYIGLPMPRNPAGLPTSSLTREKARKRLILLERVRDKQVLSPELVDRLQAKLETTAGDPQGLDSTDES